MTDAGMSPKRYDQVRELFLQVCELDPLEQSAILDEACADDPDLRREVQSLLTEDDTGSGVLGRDAAGRGIVGQLMEQDYDGAGLGLPRTVGRYRLLRVIGKGGMGIVYEAEQDQPRRTVAVKLLRAGIMSPASSRRFEFEAQVLGLLQHPGIAQIHDAGAAETEYGRQPYFAMELVHGQQLLNYARQQSLSVRERLALMARICDAVQHAHAKGVIHRDLKPSNIVIDETGQPKILDFGVARATECDIKTTTLHTEAGQLVGTVAYMSPEQASGEPNAVDTRSDVYALGVICHELLTGQLPYPLQGVPLHEAVRIIREQEPVRLSRIDRSLRGDVETIVAKALEKDPQRRYQSAVEFGADLRRYLLNEPVLATPITTGYQLRKLIARNRAAFAAALVCAGVVVIGAASTSWGLLRALDERDNARAAEQSADRERTQARELAARAEDEAIKARAVNSFLQDLLSSGDPGAPTPKDLSVRDLLVMASDRVQSEPQEHWEVEAAIHYTLGASFLALGDTNSSAPHLSIAYDLRLEHLGEVHQDTLEVSDMLCWQDMTDGHFTEAIERANRTMDLAMKRFGPAHPQTHTALYYLALAYLSTDRYADAKEHLARAVALQEQSGNNDTKQYWSTVSTLGRVYLELGDQKNAEIWTRQGAAGFARKFGESHPFTLVAAHHVASVLQIQGNLKEALEIRRRNLAVCQERLGPTNRVTVECMAALAKSLRVAGEIDEAERLSRETLALMKDSLGPDHPDVLSVRRELGADLMMQRRFQEAAEQLRDVLERQSVVLGADHLETMSTLNNLAEVLRRSGEFAEAELLLRRLHGVYEKTLGHDHPRTQGAVNNLCLALHSLKKWEEAESLLRDLVEIRRNQLGEAHAFTRESTTVLIEVLRAQGKAAEAFEWSAQLASSPSPHVGKLPVDPYQVQYAGCLVELNRFEEAEPILTQQLAPLNLETAASQRLVAIAMRLMIKVLEATARPDEAQRYQQLLGE